MEKAKGFTAAAAAAKSLQSCLTLCDPIDSSPSGSPVPGIPQARTLEWVVISFSNAWKWKVKVKLLSRVWLLATPWTAAHQAPPSMGFSRQEYWSGVPSPSLPRPLFLPIYHSWALLFSLAPLGSRFHHSTASWMPWQVDTCIWAFDPLDWKLMDVGCAFVVPPTPSTVSRTK